MDVNALSGLSLPSRDETGVVGFPSIYLSPPHLFPGETRSPGLFLFLTDEDPDDGMKRFFPIFSRDFASLIFFA